MDTRLTLEENASQSSQSTSKSSVIPRTFLCVGEKVYSEVRPSVIIDHRRMRDLLHLPKLSVIVDEQKQLAWNNVSVSKKSDYSLFKNERLIPASRSQVNLNPNLVSGWKKHSVTAVAKVLELRRTSFNPRKSFPLDSSLSRMKAKTVTSTQKYQQWDSSIMWSHRQVMEDNLYKQRSRLKQTNQEKNKNVRKNTKVIIIGAGMAGLSAASSLLKHGFEHVKVLEASDRIGGRIHTVSFGIEPQQENIELGVAELDHPKQWTSLLNEAKKQGRLEKGTKVIDRHKHSTSMCMRCDEKTVQIFPREVCFHREVIDSEIEALNGLKSKCNAISLAARDYFRESLRRSNKRMLSCGVGKDWSTHVTAAATAYTKNLKCQHGDDLGDSDVQQFVTKRGSSLFQPAKGMSSLLDPLTQNFKSDTVLHGTRVTCIDWSSFTVANEREGGDCMVTVTCSDGRRFQAHHVIVAVPLGFLKSKAQSMFTPCLPRHKLQAIENMGLGCICKVFLQFPKPIHTKGFHFLWSPSGNDKNASDGKDGMYHESVEEGDDAIYCKIKQTAIGFFAEMGSCVLQVTFADSSPEDIEDEKLSDALTCILKYRLQKDIPSPLKVTKTKWRKNPLYAGTHPYLKAGRCPKDIIGILAEPVYFRSKPVILFAGDATHNCQDGGLLHAARESGLREAERLRRICDNMFGFDNLNCRSV